ncbi:type I restriction enzyme, S subunit [Belliella buryatensis]|uniref:Type I restriction enzyme, S subunit n=1 Tax=Belliella buryatensis TaxID=1500549 RepID=A0A239BEG3_9BACT|nr:restriction endonuclease subunit S [Belliella buryatensis]SNS06427.1 type I restriction enzyme, S subunit [Belliella buryatensis]
MEKESTRKPKLRFSGFSENWEKTTLGEILTFKNGLNAGKEDYGDGEKFINVLDIIQNNFITHDKIIGSVKASEKNKELYKVEFGDVLFQRSSETREEVGQANVYLDREKPALFGGFVIRGKKKSEYDPIFINHLLKTPLSRQEITSKSGGSTRYNVSQETLSSVEITIASLPEQQKIASFLSSVDERIELLEQKKEKLEVYKKGVMQQIFSQQIRFKQDDGTDFPDWEERKLGEIALVTTGSSNRQDSGLQGEYTFFDRSVDIRRSPIFLFDCEAVIIPGEGQDFIPRHFEGKFDLHQRTYAIMQFTSCFGKFIYYKLCHDRKHLHSQAVGSTVKSLRLPTFKSLPVLLPSLDEQQKIVTFLDSLQSTLNQIESQIGGLKTWKKGLLQQMFV